MPLGSIRNAYDAYQQHDFSRQFQFRLINIFGAPPYVHEELIERPLGAGGTLYMTTASIPGRAVTPLEVKYQGFSFKVPGAVSYPDNPWKVKFKTPGDYLIRNALEAWNFELFSDESSCGNFKIPCQSTTIRVGLTDNSCKIFRVYDIIGVFPSLLSPIEYDQEGVEITTFTVDFAYQYWRLRPNNDTGSVNSASVESRLIDSAYTEYHNRIVETGVPCDPIPST